MAIEIEFTESDSATLKRRKKAVAKNYKLTKSQTIEEANHLAVFLFALGRFDESAKLLDSYIENSPFVEHRPERWEAVCLGMLLKAHISKLRGEIEEFNRLFEILNTNKFNPSAWVKLFSYEEFALSTEAGIDEMEYSSKYEKLVVRVEGFFNCLVALYIWSGNITNYKGREQDINKLLNSEISKIKQAVS